MRTTLVTISIAILSASLYAQSDSPKQGESQTQGQAASSTSNSSTSMGAGNPPAPASNKPKQVRINQGVAGSMLVHKVIPAYPADTVNGTVVLQAIIGTDGRIKSLKPVSSTSQVLADAAIAAVEQWRYKPFTLKGEPVEVLTTIDVAFAPR